ncbi:MAG TPA: NAD(+) synthase [Longimicrobiales bacterium]|nr:NAD(+) synthase [Longimicrobiales bacterium]
MDDGLNDIELRDAAELRRRLVDWIREQVEAARMRGVIFGLSGGVDSAVVCGLAVEALGAGRCLGVIMPAESVADDARLAREVAARFDVATIEVELSKTFATLRDTLSAHAEAARAAAHGVGTGTTATGPAATAPQERLAQANLKPRLRMITLYYYANLLDYLVVGTGNRAEFTLGYFTKWGDGAADIFPLAELLKHEVWAVARDLGVPAEVTERAPSAGLWSGQTDEEEMGLRYVQIDRYLATGTSGDAAVDAEIERRNRSSRHKVAPPPAARLD